MPDAQPVSGPRASDAERDEVVARLTEEFAAGRLSQDTFLFRMSAVLEARHKSQLSPLLADLPPAPESSTPAQDASAQVASAAGTPASAAPVQAVPLPAASVPAAERASAAPEQRGWPAAAQASLVSRLRAALPQWARPGRTQLGYATNGPVRRLTGAMQRTPADARRPLPLQFPRGAGTLFSIGRDVGCDLAIADMTVSRVHARLERTPDGWLLTDLASTNGTRVNGWLVRGQVQLRAGDLVSFGNAEYRLSPTDSQATGNQAADS